MKIITTSWDDGHPLDFRLAELLDKYNLKGTFYIPQHNAEHEVMSEEKVVELSQSFEIGGHTIHHVRLNTGDKNLIDKEINESFTWLQNITNTKPVSFAFPGGKYNDFAVKKVFESGYAIARTTELFSKKNEDKNCLMPTTLQVYQHTNTTYTKHLLKRKRIVDLIKWMQQGCTTNLFTLTENYINDIHDSGGCFHLWGHSWELEEYHLWKKLEGIFKIISQQPGFSYLTNGELATI